MLESMPDEVLTIKEVGALRKERRAALIAVAMSGQLDVGAAA